MPEYISWEQVAGYFDGDGTIATSDLSNLPYKLSLSLAFVDQSREQIEMLKRFLEKSGVQSSNVLKTSKGTAYMIAVSRFEGVLTMLHEMIPYLFKKSNEAQTAIDYYEGRTQGNELIRVFSAEVDAGRRERRGRKVRIEAPYTFAEGDRIMNSNRRAKLRDAFGRYRAKVTPEDYAAITVEHFEKGMRLCDLVKAHPQYARETIRRILGKGRGRVLIRGQDSVGKSC